jgi:tetratricopeptide (TPR) repeat protein
MKRFCLASLAVILALAASEAGAQTGTARGKVVDEKGQPMEGVKVEIDFQGGVTRHFETKTNKKGEFTQVGLQPGVYKFVAQKEGYQGTSNEVRVSLGDPTYLPEFKLTSVAAATKAAVDDVQGPFTQALELSKQGKLDEAEALYKEILAKNPTIPQVHYNLGWIAGQKKDWAGAEVAYKKALELKPDFSDASVALAKVYQDSGQGEKAMALMTQAGAGDAKVQFNLGVMHLTANKNDDAEAAFKKAEAIDATNPEIQYYLATIALNKGKTEECLALLEKYLAMSPTNTQNVATAQGLLQALKPKK